jgi:hypothetical protein
MKRARTGEGCVTAAGRAQLLIASSDLQDQLGKKYCGESELLPLLFSFGIVRRVQTIEIEVRPLGGDSFRVSIDAANPTVLETKSEIARVQGTPEIVQELYRVAVRTDGSAVREDDEEPEPLENSNEKLSDGESVAMAVRELEPLLWKNFAKDSVELSEGGALLKTTAQPGDDNDDAEPFTTLVTTGTKMTEGRHYWEVELAAVDEGWLAVGVTRPNLDPNGDYADIDCLDSWLVGAIDGGLYGNGRESSAPMGQFVQGDRVGVLLDVDDGSLLFFKNGVQHGPGYPAGSITGPVVPALQLEEAGVSVRLHSNLRQWPAGHRQ